MANAGQNNFRQDSFLIDDASKRKEKKFELSKRGVFVSPVWKFNGKPCQSENFRWYWKAKSWPNLINNNFCLKFEILNVNWFAGNAKFLTGKFCPCFNLSNAYEARDDFFGGGLKMILLPPPPLLLLHSTTPVKPLGLLINLISPTNFKILCASNLRGVLRSALEIFAADFFFLAVYSFSYFCLIIFLITTF